MKFLWNFSNVVVKNRGKSFFVVVNEKQRCSEVKNLWRQKVVGPFFEASYISEELIRIQFCVRCHLRTTYLYVPSISDTFSLTDDRNFFLFSNKLFHQKWVFSFFEKFRSVTRFSSEKRSSVISLRIVELSKTFPFNFLRVFRYILLKFF